MARSVRFLISLGILVFVLGRILPKRWFRAESAFFRCHAFEKEGELYGLVRVRYWHKKVPDMSQIFPRIMPKKSLQSGYSQNLERMVQETCVAEFSHLLLIVLSLYLFVLQPNVKGLFLYLLYNLVFNVPYIIIQRYNRPRLQRLALRIREKNAHTPSTHTARHRVKTTV